MKTIIRNFISVLRRFKMATCLNILGLSVAFAAFSIIIMQVLFEKGYDRFHANAACIYRVETLGEDSVPMALINRPLADALIQSSPHVKEGVLTNPWKIDYFFTVEADGEQHVFKEEVVPVYPGLTRAFDFDILEGDAKSLEDPEKVLLPKSLAQKIFGNTSAIGKHLVAEKRTLTVGAVYKDLPRNSLFKNVLYVALPKDENLTGWGNWNYHLYLQLDSPEAANDLLSNFKKIFDATEISTGMGQEYRNVKFRLSPLADIYFDRTVLHDTGTAKGSRETVELLLLIAFLIVLIAAINFANFATALTPLRVKSINTQKVLGGSDVVLRVALVFEAIFVSLVSFFLALGLISILSETKLATLIEANMTLGANTSLLLCIGIMSVLVGFFAGLYPAYYITSFPPALVLKGSFGLSPSGRKLRNMLISIQFIASISLIIGSLFMYLQNDFMQHAPLGFNKDQVAIVKLNSTVKKNKSAYIDKLKSFSGIEDVGFADAILSGSDNYMVWGCQYMNRDLSFTCIPVDPSFLRIMNITIEEGRDFRNEDALTQYGSYIFNQKAREMFDLKIGEGKVRSGEIVGFIPNIKFASFRNEVKPLAFFVSGIEDWGMQSKYSYIKIKAGTDVWQAVQHIRQTLTQLDPVYPFDLHFYDEVLNNLYQKEEQLSLLISLFGLTTVFISIVGVFGLVVFESQYRRKEIGLRKVHGASTAQILLMFNKTYLYILLVCFVIASPIAYFAVASWLTNFAYRIPIYAWVFFLAFTIVVFITALTVTFQNWKTANENPIHSIKNE